MTTGPVATGSAGDGQLDAIAATQARMALVQRRAARLQAVLCIGLGILIGGMHLAITIFRPDVNRTAFLVTCAVIVVGILVLTLGYIRVRRAVPAGAGRRYLLGLVGSIVLYMGGLIFVLTVGETVPVAILVAVVIAAPLVIVGIVALGRGGRAAS